MFQEKEFQGKRDMVQNVHVDVAVVGSNSAM